MTTKRYRDLNPGDHIRLPKTEEFEVMSTTQKCSTCGVYLWSWILPHVCPPSWRVKIPEWRGSDDEDAVTVYAIDAEAAAEAAVENADEMNELAQDDGCVEAHVLVGDKWVVYVVSASYSVDYSAEPKED
jgi:hypothetical protein